MDPAQDLAKTSGEELLNSGFLSDAEVIVGDRVWKVHKVILCPRSAYFMKALNGHFQEAKTGQLIIHDISTELMDIILTYLYTCQLDFSKFGLDRILEIYQVADYFGINYLQTAAIGHFDKQLQAQAFSICTSPIKLSFFSALDSSPAPWSDDQLDQFFSAAKILYADIDTGFYKDLRKPFKRFLKMTFLLLGKDHRFTAALESVPELAVDLFKIAVDTKSNGLNHARIISAIAYPYESPSRQQQLLRRRGR